MACSSMDFWNSPIRPILRKRNPQEQTQLLRMVLLNCSIDGATVQPTYRKPFDLIFEKGKRTRMVAESSLENPSEITGVTITQRKHVTGEPSTLLGGGSTVRSSPELPQFQPFVQSTALRAEACSVPETETRSFHVEAIAETYIPLVIVQLSAALDRVTTLQKGMSSQVGVERSIEE